MEIQMTGLICGASYITYHDRLMSTSIFACVVWYTLIIRVPMIMPTCAQSSSTRLYSS
jgi:hypothetical protein